MLVSLVVFFTALVPRAKALDTDKRDASMTLTAEAPHLVDMDDQARRNRMNRDVLARGVKRCLEPDSTTNSSDLEGFEPVALEENRRRSHLAEGGVRGPRLLEDAQFCEGSAPRGATVARRSFSGGHVTQQPPNFYETKGDAVHHNSDDSTVQMPGALGEAAWPGACETHEGTRDMRAPGPLAAVVP